MGVKDEIITDLLSVLNGMAELYQKQDVKIEDLKCHIANIQDPDEVITKVSNNQASVNASDAVSTAQEPDAFECKVVPEDFRGNTTEGILAAITECVFDLHKATQELPDNNAIHADRKERFEDMCRTLQGACGELVDRGMNLVQHYQYEQGQTKHFREKSEKLAVAIKDFHDFIYQWDLEASLKAEMQNAKTDGSAFLDKMVDLAKE